VRNTYDPNWLDAIRYINSNHLSTVEENIIFSLNRRSLGEMGFSESISNVRYNGGQLQFDAATGDPYFMLPAFGDAQFNDTVLYLTIETEEQLNVAIYFETETGQGYSEENTLQRYIEVGLNRIVFDLNGIATGSRIRIDPGHLPGRYSIQELEIRAQ
jgi:hypothetical protein